MAVVINREIRQGEATLSEPAKPNQVLAIVCAGIVLANLDLFIVNVALPNIAQEFNEPNLGNLSWILNGYAIVMRPCWCCSAGWPSATPETPASWRALPCSPPRRPRARSPTVSRRWSPSAFAGGGAALLTPTSLGLILATFPPERRAGAVRTWAAVGGFAAALGPLVGGLLVTASWRWIFLVNVPIGLIALWVGWIKLPRVPGHEVPAPSYWAALLVTVGIGALTFGIVKLNDGGAGAATAASSFAAAAVTLALFVAHCLRSDNPFVNPALFRIRDFTRATLTIAPFSTASGFLLSLVLWEESVWHWPAMKIGLAIAPGPFMVPVTSLLLAGPLISRFGAEAVVAIGLGVFAAGVLVWALLAGPQPELWFAVLCVIPSGIGVGLTLPTLMGSARPLPSSSFATGSAVINMVRQIGFAVGVALFVAIVGTPESVEARTAAFRLAWWVMAAITAIGLIPLFVLRRKA
jgi:MFS family permease